jgi:hypothetical protein
VTQQEGRPIDLDERTRRFAAAMLRASRRQLAVSLALTGAIALALAGFDAPA